MVYGYDHLKHLEAKSFFGCWSQIIMREIMLIFMKRTENMIRALEVWSFFYFFSCNFNSVHADDVSSTKLEVTKVCLREKKKRKGER